MTLAALYYAMLFTNWRNPNLYNNHDAAASDQSKTAYWVKISCEWLTMAIYVFSLVGPLLFPDRHFE